VSSELEQNASDGSSSYVAHVYESYDRRAIFSKENKHLGIVFVFVQA
jgi:hypothetical protein